MYEDLLGPVPTKENPCEEIDLPAEQTIIVDDECDCGDECDGSGKCHTGSPTPKDPWGVAQDSGCDDNGGCDGCAGC